MTPTAPMTISTQPCCGFRVVRRSLPFDPITYRLNAPTAVTRLKQKESKSFRTRPDAWNVRTGMSPGRSWRFVEVINGSLPNNRPIHRHALMQRQRQMMTTPPITAKPVEMTVSDPIGIPKKTSRNPANVTLNNESFSIGRMMGSR